MRIPPASMLAPLALAVLAAPAAANTLSAPDTVYATQDGSFGYTLTVTIDPDSAVIAGLGWDSGTNTNGGFHGDCFCTPDCRIGPGEEVTWDVQGILVNPALPGEALNWIAFCGDPDIHVTTTVMPYDPTPTRATTWGRIKVLYR
jgi:hypothetical protein